MPWWPVILSISGATTQIAAATWIFWFNVREIRRKRARDQADMEELHALVTDEVTKIGQRGSAQIQMIELEINRALGQIAGDMTTLAHRIDGLEQAVYPPRAALPSAPPPPSVN